MLLPWVSALVLLIGVGAFLGMRYSNTAKVSNANANGPVIPVPTSPKNIPFPPAAWRVAREFVFTALPRKHLAESYAITHPTLRSGYTLKEWEAGTLPMAFFPTGRVLKYNWKHTNYAHPREAQINVWLFPTKSSSQMPVAAQIGLRKVGKGLHAQWLVDYFATLPGIRVPTYL